MQRVFVKGGGWTLQKGDESLSALLATQMLITFVALPLATVRPVGHWLLDIGRLLFAALCTTALTNRREVRFALFGALLLLAAGPAFWGGIAERLRLAPEAPHEAVSLTAFGYNALVTWLVARRTFGPGRVTRHRLEGAVLVYLNVAALFAVAFDILETHAAGAIRTAAGALIPATPGARTAELSYFSLSTITTTGFGDLIPVHPIARSLANLEGAFGQLFPATFVARLVALHLVHSRADEEPPDG